MTKKILFILALAMLTGSLFSQTLNVSDAVTHEKLSFATVTTPSANFTTDYRGTIELPSLRDTDLITVSILGYETYKGNMADLRSRMFNLLMQPTNIRLDEVVVSATRWEQSKREIPNKISTISQKQAELQNPQTAADLLGSSGEVFIQKSQQGGGSPMIRGFSTNRLLYSVDGVRMNTAIFRAGNLQNVISLDPFSIENTEVFFGPGSIIYGSDALGAAMVFNTLKPQFSENNEPLVKGKALTRYSSANNEITGHFDVSLGWKKWAATTSITHYNFGDLMQGSKGPDEYLRTFYVKRMDSIDRVFVPENPLIQSPSGYSQINVMQKVRFKPNEKWDFIYGFHYSETSPYARYDRLFEYDSKGLPTSAVWDYGPQKWMMNHLEATHAATNALYDRMTIRFAYQNFEESRIDRKFGKSRLRTQLEEVAASSLNVDFLKTKGNDKFFYGIEAVLNDVTSTGTAINIKNGQPESVSSRYPNSNWATYAAYLTYQHRFSPKWLLQAGARYSLYSVHSDFSALHEFYPFSFSEVDLHKGAPTGSLGFVFTPTGDWTLSANASTGFRAPNVDDIGKMFDFVSGEVIVPNPELKAEYAYNGEINIAKTFGRTLKIDLTGFYTLLDNAMVRREYLLDGKDSIMYNGAMSKVFALQNTAHAYVYGLNAGLEIKLPKGFSISGRYNYQFGEEEMDDGTTSSMRHVAPPFGSAKLSYSANRLDLQLYGIFSAGYAFDELNVEEQGKMFLYARDANGNPYSPSWNTLNFKALYRLGELWTVGAGLENMTDQRYRPYSSGISAAGRNFILSLTAKF